MKRDKTLSIGTVAILWVESLLGGTHSDNGDYSLTGATLR